MSQRSPDPIGSPAVVEALGERTWLAHQPTYGRCVLSLEGEDAIETKREALRRIEHAGVRQSLGRVPVHQGTAHLLSYLPGTSLDRRDRSAYQRDPRTAVELAMALLEILEEAHRRGVVHGCIERRHVIAGERIGLVGFGQAPPDARPRDDVDAVGGILYELVTGEPWTTWAPAATYFAPTIGDALDEWLAILVEEAVLPPIARLRAMLRSVEATMPLARPIDEVPAGVLAAR